VGFSKLLCDSSGRNTMIGIFPRSFLHSKGLKTIGAIAVLPFFGIGSVKTPLALISIIANGLFPLAGVKKLSIINFIV